MALRKTDDLAFTMFPFLDALSGVIGVLALIISTLAVLGLSSARQVVDAGSHGGLRPVYIECRQQSYLVHPEQLLFSEQDLGHNRRLDQLVWSAGQSQGLLVLLVRPAGVSSFSALAHYLQTNGLRFSYYPVDESGQIVVE